MGSSNFYYGPLENSNERQVLPIYRHPSQSPVMAFPQTSQPPHFPSSGDTLPFPSSAIESALNRRTLPAINGNMNGNLNGDMNGNLNGDMNGNINGNIAPKHTNTNGFMTDAPNLQPNVQSSSQQPSDSRDRSPSSTPPLHSASTSTATPDVLHRRLKDMVLEIQNLRDMGVERFDIPLPKICVIGDQSAGKSSLIEGLSEIQVPRSAGTCTRCPIEINLSEGGSEARPWHCEVSLIKKYRFDSNARRNAQGSSRTRPLGPWHEEDPTILPFQETTDKSHLTTILNWAQLATLNPSANYQSYIPGLNYGTPDTLQVKFSPNVVRLNITGPQLTSLSFFDLPGIISVTENDEEGYLPGLIKSLVKEYISSPNCINILTRPMTNDGVNSNAAQILRVLGAENRTLGVLTKPDLFVHEAEEMSGAEKDKAFSQWLGMLRGDMFKLGHGYFVVHNSRSSSTPYDVARHEERSFFTRAPWTTSLQPWTARFGTERLKTTLAQLLQDQIRANLPEISEKIEARRAEISEELKSYPDPPSANFGAILMEQIVNFDNELRAQFDGGSAEHPLQSDWNKLGRDLRQALRASRPMLTIRAKDEGGPGSSLNAPSRPRNVDRRSFVPSSPIIDISDTEAPTPKRGSPSPSQPVVPGGHILDDQTEYHTRHFARFRKPICRYTLDDIRRIHIESYNAGIPNLLNPKAIEILNKQSVEHWDEPAKEFLETTGGSVRALLDLQVERFFGPYRAYDLHKVITDTVGDFFEHSLAEQKRNATELYEMERSKPFMMDEKAHDREMNIAWAHLKQARHDIRAKNFLDHSEEHAKKVKVFRARQRTGEGGAAELNEYLKMAKAQVKDEQLGPDPFEREIKTIAIVRGYYELASSRYVDYICHNIHAKLFAKCRDGLGEALKQVLGIKELDGNTRLMELMVEAPEQEQRRSQLKRDMARLTQAQEWVDGVRVDNGGGRPTTLGANNANLSGGKRTLVYEELVEAQRQPKRPHVRRTGP